MNYLPSLNIQQITKLMKIEIAIRVIIVIIVTIVTIQMMDMNQIITKIMKKQI